MHDQSWESRGFSRARSLDVDPFGIAVEIVDFSYTDRGNRTANALVQAVGHTRNSPGVRGQLQHRAEIACCVGDNTE